MTQPKWPTGLQSEEIKTMLFQKNDTTKIEDSFKIKELKGNDIDITIETVRRNNDTGAVISKKTHTETCCKKIIKSWIKRSLKYGGNRASSLGVLYGIIFSKNNKTIEFYFKQNSEMEYEFSEEETKQFFEYFL